MTNKTSGWDKDGGFVLPTVLVASIMLLLILLAGLQLASAAANALVEQYYNQLAREAAEAGVVRMNECISRGYDSAIASGVRPGTDCRGNGTAIDVFRNDKLRSYFVGEYTSTTNPRRADVKGYLELIRKSDGRPYKTYIYNSRQQAIPEVDFKGTRASKRWWCIGGSVCLDFGVGGSNKPTPHPHPTHSSGPSHEGLTTISDRNGNLKFYSDGLRIWNSARNIMQVDSSAPDGNPTCDDGQTAYYSESPQGLCGSRTGTQAVVAFPINKEESKYLVVSNSANGRERAKFGTLYYHVVDFTNDPLGRVTKKNMSIGMAGSFSRNYSGEAMNAVPNNAGNGAVVYTYRPGSPNQVYAFNIFSTDNGATIQTPNAAVYNVPSGPAQPCIVQPNPSSPSRTGFGSINFNNEATKMLVFMGGSACPNRNGNAGVLHVFDISGADTNMTPIAHWSVGVHNNNPLDSSLGYAADFSPNGDHVYVSKLYIGELFRYDITSRNSSTIKASERFIGFTSCEHFRDCAVADSLPNSSVPNQPSWMGPGFGGDGGGQVLRGPDGRVYVADRGANKISYIERPDAPNAATDAATVAAIGWNRGGLSLGSGISRYGLPQMVTLHSPRLLSY